MPDMKAGANGRAYCAAESPPPLKMLVQSDSEVASFLGSVGKVNTTRGACAFIHAKGIVDKMPSSAKATEAKFSEAMIKTQGWLIGRKGLDCDKLPGRPIWRHRVGRKWVYCANKWFTGSDHALGRRETPPPCAVTGRTGSLTAECRGDNHDEKCPTWRPSPTYERDPREYVAPPPPPPPPPPRIEPPQVAVVPTTPHVGVTATEPGSLSRDLETGGGWSRRARCWSRRSRRCARYAGRGCSRSRWPHRPGRTSHSSSADGGGEEVTALIVAINQLAGVSPNQRAALGAAAAPLLAFARCAARRGHADARYGIPESVTRKNALLRIARSFQFPMRDRPPHDQNRTKPHPLGSKPANFRALKASYWRQRRRSASYISQFQK